MAKKREIYNELEAFAQRAEEEYGDREVAFILRELATVGKTFKRKGIKEFYRCVNEHCAEKAIDLVSG